MGWFLYGGNIGRKWGNSLSFSVTCHEREVNIVEADILKLNGNNLAAFT